MIRRVREAVVLAASGPVISHTPIVVPPPWDENFEAGWAVPKGAVRGSLLCGPAGQYVAAVEWASLSDCSDWLLGTSDAARNATTVFEVRRSEVGQVRGRAMVASVAASAAARIFKHRPELGSFAMPSDQRPDIDPRTLFAVAAGEEDVDEEEELLISGGDPTFLDDSAWAVAVGSNSKATQTVVATGARALLERFVPSGSSDKDREIDHGKTGGAKRSEPEWDGIVDDTAHLIDD